MHVSAKHSILDKRCVGKEDMKNLQTALKHLASAAKKGDVKAMGTYMHFPITDNHNHAITQRVFLEEKTYDPVISVKKLLKEALPATLDAKNIKHHPYLDYCNMYTIENSQADNKNGVRFVFKKIGKFFQLKLIRFGKQ
jgi:hypothetical protein